MTQVVYVLPKLEIRDNTKTKIRKHRQKYGAGAGKCTVTDEEVLAMRRMHQIDRMTIQQVARRFSQFTENYVRSILDYSIRAQKHLWVNGG